MQLTALSARKIVATASLVALALVLFSSCAPDNQTSVAVDDSRVVKLTKDNFPAEVLKSSQPVLVDFWATWCGPCKMIAPIVAELAGEFEGRAKVGKVDVDAETDLAKQYNISAIPTLLIFKDGKVVNQIVGLRGKADLKKELEKFVEATAPAATAPKT